ncbi:MAG TPA: ATP-dependent RecD-like DNA helicase [Solirubrobacteraceae bacterium]|nr:ATP-dependent RecD-like DNA helicase [Solirubrobacteraceae bacterium]
MSTPAASETLELVLEVDAVRYRSPEGDFAVLDAITEDGEELVLTGALGHLHEGETVVASGSWREHPRHGLQFNAVQALTREPSSERGLLGYLSQIKHVGPRGAEFLLERHGVEVLATIDRATRARLMEVPGIGAGRIAAAVRSWEEQTAQRAVRLFLASHGVEAAVAGRIYRALGSDSIELLQADPYRITELDGIGFTTADALARALGTPPDAPTRLEAGVLHALTQAELDGHCHLPRAELSAQGRELLGTDVDAYIDRLAATGRLVLETVEDGVQLVYDARMHAVERQLAKRVRELLEAPSLLSELRAKRPRSGEFVPSQDQWHAVEMVLAHRLSILTGGPGTGKTTSMRTLVELLHQQQRTVRLCAPTGKAARRLAASTGVEATTIHRLLEWVPGEGFTRDSSYPIQGADVLIIDEASMLGVRLAGALLDAVGAKTHVLLVGDVDQLAPVGPGRVLEDLIAAEQVPLTALQEIFRQAARSLIVRAAHAINRGEQPPTAGPQDDVIRDFFFIQREGPAQIFSEVVSLASERLATHYGLDPSIDVQVLAPMHRGEIGIDALNTELRGRLNPDGTAVPGTPLRVGDRVIQTRNDHEHELMNGEVGLIVDHNSEREQILLATDDGRRLTLPVAALETVRQAYAISIHKSQGSQVPAVVVALARSHSIMLTRNLLYTAVTRAERVCVVVGEPAALRLALGRRDTRRRYTRLAQLVGSEQQVLEPDDG